MDEKSADAEIWAKLNALRGSNKDWKTMMEVVTNELESDIPVKHTIAVQTPKSNLSRSITVQSRQPIPEETQEEDHDHQQSSDEGINFNSVSQTIERNQSFLRKMKQQSQSKLNAQVLRVHHHNSESSEKRGVQSDEKEIEHQNRVRHFKEMGVEIQELSDSLLFHSKAQLRERVRKLEQRFSEEISRLRQKNVKQKEELERLKHLETKYESLKGQFEKQAVQLANSKEQLRVMATQLEDIKASAQSVVISNSRELNRTVSELADCRAENERLKSEISAVIENKQAVEESADEEITLAKSAAKRSYIEAKKASEEAERLKAENEVMEGVLELALKTIQKLDKQSHTDLRSLYAKISHRG